MKDAGPLDRLIRALSTLPGLGPRSARRIALHMLTHRDKAMVPLMDALGDSARSILSCDLCGNLDTSDPCVICSAGDRNRHVLCVVARVADLWAVERTGAYKGLYHCLGGVLSALDGVTPDRLRIASLIERARTGGLTEIILALSPTVDGQTTAHYITDRLQGIGNLRVSRLAHGVPLGGELDYLDDGTIATALRARGAF